MRSAGSGHQGVVHAHTGDITEGDHAGFTMSKMTCRVIGRGKGAGGRTAGACHATTTQGVLVRLMFSRSFRNQDSCSEPSVDCTSQSQRHCQERGLPDRGPRTGRHACPAVVLTDRRKPPLVPGAGSSDMWTPSAWNTGHRGATQRITGQKESFIVLVVQGPHRRVVALVQRGGAPVAEERKRRARGVLVGEGGVGRVPARGRSESQSSLWRPPAVAKSSPERVFAGHPPAVLVEHDEVGSCAAPQRRSASMSVHGAGNPLELQTWITVTSCMHGGRGPVRCMGLTHGQC